MRTPRLLINGVEIVGFAPGDSIIHVDRPGPSREEKRLAALCALSHRANCTMPYRGDLILHRTEEDAYHGSPWRWASKVEQVDDERFYLADGFVGYRATWQIIWTFDDESKQNLN